MSKSIIGFLRRSYLMVGLRGRNVRGKLFFTFECGVVLLWVATAAYFFLVVLGRA